MNEKYETRLQRAAASLTRAENALDLLGMASAHKAIKNTVKAIFDEEVDIPTVLRAEQILNDGHGNVLGKTVEARKTHEMLAIQAETGQELLAKYEKNPKRYVEWADDTRKNVQRGRPMAENVPFEPIRSGLTEFRDQLIADIVAPRSIDPFADRKEANLLRINATVKAERDFLEQYIDNRNLPKQEREDQKEETLDKFDKRIAKQLRKTHLEREREASAQQQPPHS